VSLFATASRRSEPASYLRLFLGSLANAHTTTPLSAELREHVFHLVQHAAQFANDPHYRVPRESLEAVDLAYELRQAHSLIEEILDLKSANEIRPELAQRLLHQFQHDSA
jgi:hypothetical protein